MGEALVRSEELSAEAHAALWFALATLPDNHSAWSETKFNKAQAVNAFKLGQRRALAAGMSQHDFFALVREGLQQLEERRLVVLGRDGNHDLEVRDVRLELFVPGSILLGDGL
jgi:hypothetical protein